MKIWFVMGAIYCYIIFFCAAIKIVNSESIIFIHRVKNISIFLVTVVKLLNIIVKEFILKIVFVKKYKVELKKIYLKRCFYAHKKNVVCAKSLFKKIFNLKYRIKFRILGESSNV